MLSHFPRTHVLIVAMIAMPLVSVLLFESKPHRQSHHRPTEMNVVPLPFISGTVDELSRWSWRGDLLPTADPTLAASANTNETEPTIEHIERVRAGDTVARI